MPDEVATLLQRQESYYQFQETYLAGQERVWTSDRLGYVSFISAEALRVAIVGVNSAWLAEGGQSDHGRLVVGERQVIELLQIASERDPHVVIAMGHHPFRLLNDFDGRVVERRIEQSCQFFHCGHLHDPEARDSLRAGKHCLTVAAGASFESRHSRNAYSLVSLDVLRAERKVRTLQYNPTDGEFSYESKLSFPFTINAAVSYGMKDLGLAIETDLPALSHVAYYMAALLLEVQAEVPIAVGGSYAFGSLELLKDQRDDELKVAATSFIALRNPLRLLAANMQIADFLTEYRGSVDLFGRVLMETCAADSTLREELLRREDTARSLAGIEPAKPFGHSLTLLQELAREEEWQLLREQAERHLESTDKDVALEARRMLALSLAQSANDADKQFATTIYAGLLDDETARPEDILALASLLFSLGEHSEAKSTVLTGIRRFPEFSSGFQDVGHALVESTGDRDFRDELIASRAGREAL